MEPKNSFKFDVALFLTLAAAIVCFFLLWRWGDIAAAASLLLGTLRPVCIGGAVAYVLCPVQKRLEALLRRWKPLARAARLVRLLSTLLTLMLALALVVLFCALALPQLGESVSGLVQQLPNLLETQLGRVAALLPSDSVEASSFLEMVQSVEGSVLAWVKDNMFSAVSNVAGKVRDLGSALLNLVVALVITIYLLLDRERYLSQCRKLFRAVSKNECFNQAVADVARQADRIFSGFLSGKLLDSLIVGILCFVGMLVLRIPYALLISVIVGVTNIIPMFGPFIGAVPGVFLLLLVSPRQCFVFLIFIVVLQQIDGNIIGPRILGNSTGISALYITVAMLVFGKLLGFLGMLLGVPLMATLYYIVKRLAEHSLRVQGLPTDTGAYGDGTLAEPPEIEEKA